MLAGSLQEAGLHFGNVLSKGLKGKNAKGLIEPESIIFMHENLLKKNGGSWHEPPDEIKWQRLHRAVRDLFIESREHVSQWGFKEPRTLLTFEGWADVLEDWDAIGIFRNPVEVALSLNSRNGFDMDKCFDLWVQYNQRLLALHKRYGFAIFEFSADAERTKDGIKRAIKKLGLSSSTELTFFEPSLRKFEADTTQVPASVQKLYEELRRAAESPSFTALSTRLNPKFLGAQAYRVSGIAARCDWVVLTDMEKSKTHLHKNVPTQSPRHIFLSRSHPFVAIRYFVNRILPGLKHPFVLVSGSHDTTIPNQLDKRFRRFNGVEKGLIDQLMKHPLLLHWMVENIDEIRSPKMSPLPCGMVFPRAGSHDLIVPEIRSLRDRPGQILCAHRIRGGGQWETRSQVSRLARTDWADMTTVVEGEVSEKAYSDLIQSHKFVLCVQGGGLDPSPKAWQAILHGAIPIIKSSALQAAYKELPVVFVPEWEAAAITEVKLNNWVDSLEPWITANRSQVIERLGIDYWWAKIEKFVQAP